MKQERESSDDSYGAYSYDNPFDVSPTPREDRVKLIKPKRSYQDFDNGLSNQTTSSEDVLEKMMSEY
ncbi:MAG: hypothetical protein AAF549_03175 [Pseudomonadota bacterium]